MDSAKICKCAEYSNLHTGENCKSNKNQRNWWHDRRERGERKCCRLKDVESNEYIREFRTKFVHSIYEYKGIFENLIRACWTSMDLWKKNIHFQRLTGNGVIFNFEKLICINTPWALQKLHIMLYVIKTETEHPLNQ